MADEIDRANEEVAVYEASLLYAATRPVPTLMPMGVCHYCEEVVDGKRLFCGADCAKAHQQEVEQLRRLGKG